ncbi:MAG: thioredoxin [Candidatus Aenigmatarchaeota archaeon]
MPGEEAVVEQVNDENFQEFVAEGVVAVDCYADWCPPCKMLSPVIQKLSGEMQDIKFGKLNTDENPKTAEEFQIRSIPNILVFKKGKLADQIIGFYPEEKLREIFKAFLK